MEEKCHKEVIKATGAIHIAHDLTLLQQQTWNVLLAHAFPLLEKQNTFEMPEEAFLGYFPYATRNTEHFKEILRILNVTQVEYNILGKDKKVWGVFTLLSEAELKNGILSYAYTPKLQTLLNNPAVYSKINLLIQSRFDCKYALFLYELCVDYKGVGQTPWMELEQFRKYMGLQPQKYLQFGIFNRDVLKVAVKEVNKKSDLAIQPQLQKEKKQVVALKFLIEENQRKPQTNQLTLSLTLPESPTTQRLLNLGVSPRQAKQLSQKHSGQQIEQAIHILEGQEKKVKNAGGFLKKALEENWQQKEYGQISNLPLQFNPRSTIHDPQQWFEQQDQNARCMIVADFQKNYPKATSKTHPQEWIKHLQTYYVEV